MKYIAKAFNVFISENYANIIRMSHIITANVFFEVLVTLLIAMF